MNWLDIAILIIISLFAVLGIRRGFIRGTFSFLAIIVGIVIGLMFYELTGQVLINTGLIDNKSIASVLGFILPAVICYILIQLLAWLLTKLMGALHLSIIDRIAGGFLGVIIGVIVVFFIISGLGFFYKENEPPLKESVVVPYISVSYEIIKETVPEDFKEHLILTRKIIQNEGKKAILRLKESDRVKEVIKVIKDGKGKQQQQKNKM